MTLRLLHYSDVHLTVPALGWRPRDWLSKKAIGWVNVRLLGRGFRFRHATTVADAMIADARRRGHDAVVFSGDATKLAFEPEFAFAAERLGVGDGGLPPAVAVPGNHDYYTRRDELSGKFERHFAPWLEGERVGEHLYPFARRVGHVWLICVNSSLPGFFNTSARGRVGHDQLVRLVTLCRALGPGPRILVTHYPLRTAAGKVERRSHRLIDHKAALAAAREAGIGLWLHGHIHHPFVLTPTAAIPFPVVCGGSATQTNRWAHHEYEIDGSEATVLRRLWDPESGTFTETDVARLTLPTAG
jgi:3',5'-cyclic AMP phosphodiesterase CpdA